MVGYDVTYSIYRIYTLNPESYFMNFHATYLSTRGIIRGFTLRKNKTNILKILFAHFCQVRQSNAFTKSYLILTGWIYLKLISI